MEWYQWLGLGLLSLILAVIFICSLICRKDVKQEQQEKVMLCNRAGCKLSDDCICHVIHHSNAWKHNRRDMFKPSSNRVVSKWCLNYLPVK